MSVLLAPVTHPGDPCVIPRILNPNPTSQFPASKPYPPPRSEDTGFLLDVFSAIKALLKLGPRTLQGYLANKKTPTPL